MPSIPFLGTPNNDPNADPDKRIVRASVQIERPRSYIGIQADKVALTKSKPPNGVFFQDLETGRLEQWVIDHWETIGQTFLGVGDMALSDVPLAPEDTPRPYGYGGGGGSVVAVGSDGTIPINRPTPGPTFVATGNTFTPNILYTDPLTPGLAVDNTPTVLFTGTLGTGLPTVLTCASFSVALFFLVTTPGPGEASLFDVTVDGVLVLSVSGGPADINDFSGATSVLITDRTLLAAFTSGATIEVEASTTGALRGDLWCYGFLAGLFGA